MQPVQPLPFETKVAHAQIPAKTSVSLTETSVSLTECEPYLLPEIVLQIIF
jgi:hypothetical protein